VIDEVGAKSAPQTTGEKALRSLYPTKWCWACLHHCLVSCHDPTTDVLTQTTIATLEKIEVAITPFARMPSFLRRGKMMLYLHVALVVSHQTLPNSLKQRFIL